MQYFTVFSSVSVRLSAGPDVLLMSTRGKGAVRQQPWREAPNQTAPLPATTT